MCLRGSEPLEPERRDYLTITELTGKIRGLLEGAFPSLRVGGEVSNYFLSRAGHHYFTLKDEASQVKIVLFRGRRSQSGEIKDGVFAVVQGALAVYGKRGEYQVVAESVDVGGIGELIRKFQMLRDRLKEEGLFEEERKKRLPFLAKRIGIVTSLDGAAVRDIVRVVRNRFENTEIVISPSLVQGKGAAEDISRAVKLLDDTGWVDLIIVGRGGGSMEDLWAFNEEIVVRSIASAGTPIVSAVGHETDFTLADFAADYRASTPSNAAEIAVIDRGELKERMGHFMARIFGVTMEKIEVRRGKLHYLRGELKDPRVHVRAKRLNLADLEERMIACSPGNRVDSLRLEVRERILTGERMLKRKVYSIRASLEKLTGKIESLDPGAILSRGYSITFDETGKTIIRSRDEVAPGERIRTQLHKGKIVSRVEGG